MIGDQRAATEASCHCGAVRLRLDDAPLELNDCNCSICRRYGSLWAYYSPSRVQISSAGTDIYMWDERSIEFHRCKQCGCITHWSPVDASVDRMGINGRLLPPDVVERARVRHSDGAGTGEYLNE